MWTLLYVCYCICITLQGFGDGRFLQIKPSGSYSKASGPSWSKQQQQPHGSSQARPQGPRDHAVHPQAVEGQQGGTAEGEIRAGLWDALCCAAGRAGVC